MVTAREKIANGLLKASTKLAAKELGGRDRVVKYRLRAGSGGDADLGITPTKQDWSLASAITPNPVVFDMKNYKEGVKLTDTGLISLADVKLTINRPLFTREQLESYEYYINGTEYDIVGGQVYQEPYYWIVYLRKK